MDMRLGLAAVTKGDLFVMLSTRCGACVPCVHVDVLLMALVSSCCIFFFFFWSFLNDRSLCSEKCRGSVVSVASGTFSCIQKGTDTRSA